jgi:hypothetical protein
MEDKSIPLMMMSFGFFCLSMARGDVFGAIGAITGVAILSVTFTDVVLPPRKRPRMTPPKRRSSRS